MLFAVNWVYKVLGKTSYFGMDDDGVCSTDKLTKWLKDDEHAIVLAKTVAPTDKTRVQNCDIKLSPSSGNKNKTLQFKFETFYIKDCDVQLDIKQSLTNNFEDSSNLASLSCHSDTLPDTLYSDNDNTVLLRLQRTSLRSTDYNFRINVTTVPERPEIIPEESNNLPIIIGGASGGAIVLILMLFCFLKLMFDRRRRAGKQSSTPVTVSGGYEIGSRTRETTAIQVSCGETDEKHPFTPSSQPLLNPPPSPHDLEPGPTSISLDPPHSNPARATFPPTYEEAMSHHRPQPTAPPIE